MAGTSEILPIQPYQHLLFEKMFQLFMILPILFKGVIVFLMTYVFDALFYALSYTFIADRMLSYFLVLFHVLVLTQWTGVFYHRLPPRLIKYFRPEVLAAAYILRLFTNATSIFGSAATLLDNANATAIVTLGDHANDTSLPILDLDASAGAGAGAGSGSFRFIVGYIISVVQCSLAKSMNLQWWTYNFDPTFLQSVQSMHGTWQMVMACRLLMVILFIAFHLLTETIKSNMPMRAKMQIARCPSSAEFKLPQRDSVFTRQSNNVNAGIATTGEVTITPIFPSTTFVPPNEIEWSLLGSRILPPSLPTSIPQSPPPPPPPPPPSPPPPPTSIPRSPPPHPPPPPLTLSPPSSPQSPTSPYPSLSLSPSPPPAPRLSPMSSPPPDGETEVERVLRLYDERTRRRQRIHTMVDGFRQSVHPEQT